MNAEEMIELDDKYSAGLRNNPDAWRQQAALMANHMSSLEEISQNNAALHELGRYMQIRRKRSAIYSIKNQPFYRGD